MGNGLRYEIPRFQRDYSWDAENWDDLWLDINGLLREEDSEHYMGYLVLQTLNNKEFQIIDGQQRLTTMSLLILATLKCLKELAEAGIDSEDNTKRRENLLNSYIGHINPVTLISNNKLTLNRNGNDYYKQHLVLLNPRYVKNMNAAEKHMRDCFEWFYERIKNQFKTGHELAAFIDSIVDKLFFTVIEVSDHINAFKVFETLNSRGVQLSASDLLKNHFFSVVDETRPHISELEELENIWSKIGDKLGEQTFEEYLRYYWNSQYPAISKKNLFKAIRNNIINKQQVFDLIRNLNDSADLFMAIQNPEDDFWKDQPETKKHLKELKLFQIKQTYSLFLSALRKLSPEEFRKISQICSVISFRYNIIGGLNPNAQEDVYNAVARGISQTGKYSTDDFLPVYVSDRNFETAFSTKEFKSTTRNHKIVKYLLAKIEYYQFRHEIDPESDLFTIEHILPENALGAWGEFNLDDIHRFVYRIGNLTLLEKKLNREAGQKPWSEKKLIFSQSSCSLTRAVAENYDSWNENKLDSRQQNLAKQAKAVWKIQELSDRKG